MKGVRGTREKKYEETKDTTSEERIEYIRKKAGKVIRDYGLKLKPAKKPR